MTGQPKPSETAGVTLVECGIDMIELSHEVRHDTLVLQEMTQDKKLKARLQVRLEPHNTVFVAVREEHITSLKTAHVTFQQLNRSLLQLIGDFRSGALKLPDGAVMRVLHLNEWHFKPEDLLALKKPVPAVLALPRNGHGLLLHLDPDWTFPEEFPPNEFSTECMALLQRICCNMGFSYVRIDRDGIVMRDLPLYS